MEEPRRRGDPADGSAVVDGVVTLPNVLALKPHHVSAVGNRDHSSQPLYRLDLRHSAQEDSQFLQFDTGEFRERTRHPSEKAIRRAPRSQVLGGESTEAGNHSRIDALEK